MQELPLFLKVRELFAWGELEDYFDNANVVGFVRRGDEAHPDSGLAVLISDGTGGQKQMTAGNRLAGRTMVDCTGHVPGTVQVGTDGRAVFRVQGGSISVWVTEEASDRLFVEGV